MTDASVVLGYIDPERFAGGVGIRPELAREAIGRHIARPLELTLEQAALGIHRIVNAQVAEGIRFVSIRRGHDPRGFTLLPLGGGGALHACALADELGISRILVPRLAGVLSAAGLLAAPIEHEVSAALPRAIDALDPTEIRATLHRLDGRCQALMTLENAVDVQRRYFADVCYVGQGYHLQVPFEPQASRPVAALARAFYVAHERTYGHARQAPIRLVNLRAVHSALGASPPADTWSPAAAPALVCMARILLPDQQAPVEAAVYRRAALRAGGVCDGPAIIAQDDTTTLVAPGWHCRVDSLGNLVLERLTA